MTLLLDDWTLISDLVFNEQKQIVMTLTKQLL